MKVSQHKKIAPSTVTLPATRDFLATRLCRKRCRHRLPLSPTTTSLSQTRCNWIRFHVAGRPVGRVSGAKIAFHSTFWALCVLVRTHEFRSLRKIPCSYYGVNRWDGALTSKDCTSPAMCWIGTPKICNMFSSKQKNASDQGTGV